MAWIKKTRDTGWRDITSLMPVEIASGRLLIRREGTTVWLEFEALLVSESPSGSFHSWASGTIPQGFRTSRFSFVPLAPQISVNTLNYVTSTAHALGPVRVAANGGLVVYNAKRSSGDLVPIQGLVSWPTSEPFPSSFPGVND